VITTGFRAYGTTTRGVPEQATLTDVEWPEAEVHDNIFSVRINIYADKQDALIDVVAIDPDTAKDTFKRVRDNWPRLQAVIWP
jgi:hypothetical protein